MLTAKTKNLKRMDLGTIRFIFPGIFVTMKQSINDTYIGDSIKNVTLQKWGTSTTKFDITVLNRICLERAFERRWIQRSD